MRSLLADLRRWPLREPFAISRRVFVDSLALTVRIGEGDVSGWGECEPHEHEQIVGLEAQAELFRLAREPDWLATLSTDNILDRLPNQPLRNALDCALWDLAAKRSGQRVWELLGRGEGNPPVAIMPTVGLASPQEMAQAASAQRGAKALKIKLGGSDGADAMRLEAIAAAAQGVELLADINGGWQRPLRSAIQLRRVNRRPGNHHRPPVSPP
jgi:L-Ala-D/L-Glu epimerase